MEDKEYSEICTMDEIVKHSETTSYEYAYCCDFGISYLDKKLKGIKNNDLILIGADSGCGKSTMASIIASNASMQGKTPLLITLENKKSDIYWSNVYYAYIKQTGCFNITEREFTIMYNEKKIDASAYERAKIIAKEKYKNALFICGGTESYTRERLEKDITQAFRNTTTDLIIIDHLDYFDKSGSESDISHAVKLMTTIRKQQLITHIPIICISHIKKTESKAQEFEVPSKDDFYGSKDKTNKATIVITLSKDRTVNRHFGLKYYQKPTYVCIRKLRDGGEDCTVASVLFNTHTCQYEAGEKLFYVSSAGRVGESIN